MVLNRETTEEAQNIIRTLGNKYNIEILGATSEPRSAQELSEELDIPIATSYRRIEELSDSGLLADDESKLTDDRRRVSVYRRDVDSLTVTFEENGFSLDIEERSQVKNAIDGVWQRISRGDD